MHAPLSQRWQYFWALIGVPWVCLSLLALVMHANPWNRKLGDLSQDWLSARCYFEGIDVYASMDETLPKFLGIPNSSGTESLHVNAHPPTSVLMVLPLGKLSYPHAKLVWQLLTLVCVALSVVGLVSSRGLNLDRSNIWPMAVLILGSAPLASQVIMLQFNAILLLLLTGAWLAQRSGQSWLAGALLGIAASVKLFPLYLLFVFLVMRDWRALVGGVVAFAAMVGASCALFGTDAWRTFIVEVMPSLATWRGAWLNSSLTGFWSRLFDPANPYVVPITQSPLVAKGAVLVCAALLSLGVAWKGWRAQSQGERDLAYALGVVAMILCSPTAWDHYWLMLVLPLAIWWWTAEVGPVGRVVFWLCIGLLAVIRPLWAWSTLIGTEPGTLAQPIHSLTVLAYPGYCLLVLFGLLLASKDADATPTTLDAPA
jgi:alpha-1,2-mannosyltransferase